MPQRLLAGAATADITPQDSQFLFGYPHVRRYSIGVHDPLLSSTYGRALIKIAANSPYVSTSEGRGRPASRWRLEGRSLQILAKTETHV